ncbi:MAG: Uma2 family endonuclease [Saprospiraceae bacterium]|nr:Uma2 family endonuclease [Saprospiraceae bacterium]
MQSTNVATNREPKKWRISADDYQRMAAVGIFVDQPRVELINGEIIEMSPQSNIHISHVDKISRFFYQILFEEILVRTQSAVRLDEYSEPEPDITILKFQNHYYKDRAATAEDIYLVVEVAITTLQLDRNTKGTKYAQAGIPEYWIVIPEQKEVEVYRQPKDGIYQIKQTFTPSDEWIFQPFEQVIKGTDLLL